jgi:hypothetical protein
MITETTSSPETDNRTELDRLELPVQTDLGAAGSLIIGGVSCLMFGVAWAYLFYPPAGLAAAGFAVCAAFAVAAFGAAMRALIDMGWWIRHRG